MNPRRTRIFKRSTLLAFALVALACGDDDDETSNTNLPQGPPTVQIVSVSAVGGTGAPADGIQLSCQRALAVSITTTDWELRPPGTCGARLQCGYVRIAVEGTPEIRPSRIAATPTLVIDVSSLEGKFAAVTSVSAELVSDNGTPFKNADGTTVLHSFPIKLLADAACVPSGNGGVAGQAGAAGSAGVAGESGAAGDGAGGAAGTAGNGGAPGSGGVAGGAAGVAGSGGAGGLPGLGSTAGVGGVL